MELEEEIFVTATRSGRRVEDEALRVEVLGREEIEEKLLMTPGDISMLLNETAGLRVQMASPSLGAASVRVQGLRGRYTLMLSDGLPLHGAQGGSIALLQIPPMDLGQVEVIKGVASALYGHAALGGVVNLVSRRPGEAAEHEVLLNQTTENGTDGVLWLSGPWTERWGYTVLLGGHRQARADIDEDGWADLPEYRRLVVRPRAVWDDGKGRSVFVTAGAMVENREGGTMPGSPLFGGAPYAETLRTRRFDAGFSARALLGARLLSLKASGVAQPHRHLFGAVVERDRHDAWFAETSVTGTAGRHDWVAGAAVQVETYRARDVAGFDYTFTTPGVFVQDELAAGARTTIAVSARVDRHEEYGTFVNPRASLLWRPGPFTVRLSGGTGSYAPTPFTEETEAVGLTRLEPVRGLRAERARGASVDVGRTAGPFETHVTAFVSEVRHPVVLLAEEGRARLVNAAAPTRNAGVELLGRFRRAPLVATATYTWTRATEDPESLGRLEVPLTPRHAAGLVAAYERHGKHRAGIEVYYVGRQRLEDDPFRAVSRPYVVVGALAERRFGRVRAFVNLENLTDSRQTRHDPLVRPFPADDGRLTVDVWAPLEGRIVNAGVRVAF